MKLFFKEINSPVGKLKLVATDEALVAILWEKEKLGRVRLDKMGISDKHPILLKTENQLKEYFTGKRKVFDLPLNPMGTSFQQMVWNELRQIPFGETRSYGELATKMGSPKASRAVGAANGKNPISIVVPCHRVIGKNGKLTGFAGGLRSKELLLDLEAKSMR
ncbi:methylated-DNA--[protein]-cysteine S-methyltransferase [Bacteriovorax sp. PP10]|uniref:Methylated-DNA--protein-cysteine methyltransferase n=1 Tax=Bacteriovorax antarcticus TaxID=3088717 RepID=A0ABU5VW38_9BACT|nr:methylated-DNA--[protein]-cysteine S-methyltransferase [Bacteriovorax sp. PP10]MEA9357279.1 methylated-DNA--[protein]-cysteine S-methyltransferase [Bacteriovorax sp. PP10]